MKANLVPARVLVPTSFHAAGAVVWGAAAAAHGSRRARLAGKGQSPGGRHVLGLFREGRERRSACGCPSWSSCFCPSLGLPLNVTEVPNVTGNGRDSSR